MEELRELYQQVILDHNHSPRNYGAIENATAKAEGFNPLCGDKLTLFLKLNQDVIEDVRFEASGCAISVASASLLTEALKGKTIEEAESLFDKMHLMFTNGEQSAGVGKLTVLSGVNEFPARVKCATLAWHTLKAAIANEAEPATTE